MAVDGGSGADLSDPGRRSGGVDVTWLAARAEADTAARSSTLDRLIPALLEHLSAAGAEQIELLDVGAGTGANQRWLRPRLPLPQRWVQLDRDPVMSRVADCPPGTRLLTGDVARVPELLGDLPRGRRVLTCAALLDVLPSSGISTLGAAAAAAAAPVLFSLTVTGAWDLDPSDPLDGPLRRAFDDHQRRSGLAGPEALEIAAEALRAGGSTILTTDTDWHLDAGSGAGLVDRFLRERVAAAVEMRPDLADLAAGWLERRRRHLAASILRIRVGHRDLLGLPTGSFTR